MERMNKNSLILKIFWMLSLLGIPACSINPKRENHGFQNIPQLELQKRVRATAELKILFIGNSYSFAVPRVFSKHAKSRGKSVTVDQSTYSCWMLSRHARSEKTLRKIGERPWDIVVIQEHSMIPAMSAIERAVLMHPSLRKIVAAVRQQGAIPILYQTWGRRDGDPKIRDDDFHAMTARIRQGYLAASRDVGGVVIVPVGDVWAHEFSKDGAQRLFMKDGSHPSMEGDRLTAKVFYEALFGEPF
jgi:hypothetical protein